MNNSSNNGSPEDGEEHGELVWNEFDWELYLRQRDEALTEYAGCYDQVTEFPDRLDEVARRLGWEPTLDGEAEGASEDEEFDDDDLDPYTIHRNPVYVATRALFAGLLRTIEEQATASQLAPTAAFPLLNALHQAEMAVVLGVQSLDLGDSALGISQLKRAFGLFNTAMGLLPEPEEPEMDGRSSLAAPTSDLSAYALPRLFDLREICLRVVRECRDELQRPIDEEEE